MDDIAYVVGVDLGQSRDPTAIAVVRRLGRFGGADALADGTELFQCGHLERLPLNTPYPEIVLHVKSLLDRLPRGTELVIDYTGVGRPVFDMFEIAGIDPIGVLITGGTAESGDGRIFSVPKLNLVSGLQALLHEERLKIHKELPDAPVLISELQNFRVDFSPSGQMTFNARSGAHDDLVLALAIATWRARKGGGPSPLLSFYKYQAAEAKREDDAPSHRVETDSRGLPWRGTRRQITDDANELTKVYMDTFDGLQETNFCDSCHKPIGATRVTDGVSRWHPECPVPRQ
jgi:hypothetical protein